MVDREHEIRWISTEPVNQIEYRVPLMSRLKLVIDHISLLTENLDDINVEIDALLGRIKKSELKLSGLEDPDFYLAQARKDLSDGLDYLDDVVYQIKENQTGEKIELPTLKEEIKLFRIYLTRVLGKTLDYFFHNSSSKDFLKQYVQLDDKETPLTMLLFDQSPNIQNIDHEDILEFVDGVYSQALELETILSRYLSIARKVIFARQLSTQIPLLWSGEMISDVKPGESKKG